MTTRKITAKERATSTPSLHLDPKTGATVLDLKAIAESVKKTAKAAPVRHSALRDDKLSLRVVKMTMADRVRQQFSIGASLTEAAKATGADPAYCWDLAKIWEDKGNGRVPRSGHVKKEKVAKAPAVKKTPAKKAAAVATEASADDLLPA